MSDVDPRLVNLIGIAIAEKVGTCHPSTAEHVAAAVWDWFAEGDDDGTYTCCMSIVGAPHHPDCEVGGIFAGPLPG